MISRAFFRPVAVALSLTLAGGALTSCDKEIILKTLDVELSTNVTLNVSPTDPLAAVWTQELDPLANADIRDNSSKIKKVVVERLAYRVKDFTGTPGTKASGNWTFYLSGAPTQVYTIGTVSNLDLKTLSDAGTVQDLPISDDAKVALVNAINAGMKITLVFDGNVTEQPTFARFEVQLFTKIDIGT